MLSNCEGIQSELINLIENKSLSEPMTLQSIATLNNSLQFPTGMDHLLSQNLYKRLITFMNTTNQLPSNKNSPRIVIALSYLFTNVSFCENLRNFSKLCHDMFLVENEPNENSVNEILKVFELIYLHSLKYLKLNQNLVSEFHKKNDSEVEKKAECSEDDEEDIDCNNFREVNIRFIHN